MMKFYQQSGVSWSDKKKKENRVAWSGSWINNYSFLVF
jgi:hypothetical protein